VAEGEDAACVVSGTALNNVTIKDCKSKKTQPPTVSEGVTSVSKQVQPQNAAALNWDNAPPCSDAPDKSNSEPDQQGRL
jgi:hypothetical protein